MRSALILCALLLASTPVLAARVAYCDVTTNPILGRVLHYDASVDTTAAILAQHGISLIVNPDVSTLAGVPVMYWRCTAAPAVVEMTAPQKATLDAFFAQQAKDAQEAAADSAIDSQLELRASLLTLLDLINVCRTNPTNALPAITPAQARDLYLAKVESLLEP